MQRLIKPGTTHQILRERKGKWDRWMKYSKATHQTPSQRKGKMNEARRVKPGHLEPWGQYYVDEYNSVILNEWASRFQLRQICSFQGRSSDIVFFPLQRLATIASVENSDIGVNLDLPDPFPLGHVGTLGKRKRKSTTSAIISLVEIGDQPDPFLLAHV